MRILITNDDGYTSKGLRTLVEMAQAYGEVTVVAPQFPQSAMSNAVSVGKMLRLTPMEEPHWYYCLGTPVDCVKTALNVLFQDHFPDILLSGINHGSNASTAVLYSGTLGAACEASLYGIPSIAFSLCTHKPDADFNAITHFGPSILEQFIASPPAPHTYINVNFPNDPVEAIKGIRICRMGMGVWVKELEARMDPYGKPYYWMVGDYVNKEPKEALCDNNLLDAHYITIVPHLVDITNYPELARLQQAWSGLTQTNHS